MRVTNYDDQEPPTALGVLIEIRDLLVRLVDASEPTWYCPPKRSPDGVLVCPGGVRLRRHAPQWEKDPDYLYHPLAEGVSYQDVLPNGETTTVKNHNVWKSAATQAPPLTEADREGQSAAPVVDVETGEIVDVERPFNEAARGQAFADERRAWMEEVCDHYGATSGEILQRLGVDAVKFAGIWNADQLARASVKLQIAFQPTDVPDPEPVQ
jgi:hypothetical protein